MTALTFLATALALGIRHALDPDHLAAVSALVAEERRLWPAARLGLIWGAGHLVPIALLGIPVLVFRLALPPALEHFTDLMVGLLLVALGLRTLWRLRREGVHMHLHRHGGRWHAHFHAHAGDAAHRHGHGEGRRRGRMTFLIGIMHGLAGSGAAAVLALGAAPSPDAAIGYLLAFGLGTCAGMFATTLGVGAPALVATARFARLHALVRAAAGLASLGVGLLLWAEILPQLLA